MSLAAGHWYAFAWIRYSSEYRPPRAISSSWLPTSATRAPSRTTMRSAMRTVLNRCDTRIVVLPPRRACRARLVQSGRERRLDVHARQVPEADRLPGLELEPEEVLERPGQAFPPLR